MENYPIEKSFYSQMNEARARVGVNLIKLLGAYLGV